MKLIGMLDSPYVRRVAVSLKILGIPFEHDPLSVFRDFEAFTNINPVVKAPTLVTDEGTVLTDSAIILDFIERLVASDRSLVPRDAWRFEQHQRILGLALAASDKTVQLVYETSRPKHLQYDQWIERVKLQMFRAFELLEDELDDFSGWSLNDEKPTQADITLAVTWTFNQFMMGDLVSPLRHGKISALAERLERLPAFISTPLQ